MANWAQYGLAGGTAADLVAGGFLNDPGYQNFLDWVSKGAKHGTLGGKVVNPLAVSSKDTPWGENKWYDAGGNEVSLYMDAPAGVESPYGPAGTGPSAPALPAGGAGGAALLNKLGQDSYFRSGAPWTKSSRNVEDVILGLSQGESVEAALRRLGLI